MPKMTRIVFMSIFAVLFFPQGVGAQTPTSQEEAYTSTMVWTRVDGCTSTQVILKIIRILQPERHDHATLQLDVTGCGESIHQKANLDTFEISKTSISAYNMLGFVSEGRLVGIGFVWIRSEDMTRLFSTELPNGDIISESSLPISITLTLHRIGGARIIDLKTDTIVHYEYRTGNPMPE